MAGRHDRDIILRLERDPRRKVLILAKNDLIRIRIMLWRGKIRPVVEHGHAEADIVQHRRERRANVTAAEDVGCSGQDDRFGVIRRFACLIDRLARQQLGERCIVQRHPPQAARLCINIHLRNLTAAQLVEQPGIFIFSKKFTNFFQKRDDIRIFWLQNLNIDCDVAAADHAEVLNLVFCKRKSVYQRFFA